MASPKHAETDRNDYSGLIEQLLAPFDCWEAQPGRYRACCPSLAFMGQHAILLVMPKGIYKRARPEERFWEKTIIPEDPDACWGWRASLNTHGYGSFWLNGLNIGAHIYSYRLHYGDVPMGEVVRHSCDNPLCCNPRHLLAGTNGDNSNDMAVRLRTGCRKVGPEDVEAIRERVAQGESQRSLAKEYGLNPGHVSRLVRGLKWKHVVSSTTTTVD